MKVARVVSGEIKITVLRVTVLVESYINFLPRRLSIYSTHQHTIPSRDPSSHPAPATRIHALESLHLQLLACLLTDGPASASRKQFHGTGPIRKLKRLYSPTNPPTNPSLDFPHGQTPSAASLYTLRHESKDIGLSLWSFGLRGH